MPPPPVGASAADARDLAITPQELPLLIAAVLNLRPEYKFLQSVYSPTNQQLVGKVYESNGRTIFISCNLHNNGWMVSRETSNLLKQIGANLSHLFFFNHQIDPTIVSSPKNEPITLSRVNITQKTITHEGTDTGLSSAITMQVKEYYKTTFKATVLPKSTPAPGSSIQNNLRDLLNRILQTLNEKLSPEDEAFYTMVSELPESKLIDLLKEAKKIEIEEDQLPLTAITLKLIACALLKLHGLSFIIASPAEIIFTKDGKTKWDKKVYHLQHYNSFADFVTHYEVSGSPLKRDTYLCFLPAESNGMAFFIFCCQGKITKYCFEGDKAQLKGLEGLPTITIPLKAGLFKGFVTTVIEALIPQDQRCNLSSLLYPHVSLHNLGIILMSSPASQKNVALVQTHGGDKAVGQLKIAYEYYQQLIATCVKAGMFIVGFIQDPSKNHLAYILQYPGHGEVVMVIHPINLSSPMGLNEKIIVAEINKQIKTTPCTETNTKMVTFVVNQDETLQLITRRPDGDEWKCADEPGRPIINIAFEYMGIQEKDGRFSIRDPLMHVTTKSKLQPRLTLSKASAAAEADIVTPYAKLKSPGVVEIIAAAVENAAANTASLFGKTAEAAAHAKTLAVAAAAAATPQKTTTSLRPTST